MAPSRSLIDLPDELQDAVFAELDYISAIWLAATCTYLRSRVRPVIIVSDEAKRLALLRLEQAPQHAGDKGFACFKCWKVKPRADFAKTQVTGRRHKDSESIHELRCGRFCMDCGTSLGIYLPGQEVQKLDGKFYRVCPGCAKLKIGRYCTACVRCRDCVHEENRSQTNPCLICMDGRLNGASQGMQANRAKETTQGFLHYDGNIHKNLFVSMAMADYERETGEVASPEWFEDDWWRGNGPRRA